MPIIFLLYFLYFFIPKNYVISSVISTIPFIIVSTCLFYKKLIILKSLKVICNKAEDTIKFEYEMPLNTYNFEKERRLSDLKDLRIQAITKRSSQGKVRTTGHTVFLIFSNFEDQLSFTVHGGETQSIAQEYVNDIDVFVLDGLARRDSNYRYGSN